jgi:hypothetical protein
MMRTCAVGGLGVLFGVAGVSSGQIVPISRSSQAVAGYTGIGTNPPPASQVMETSGYEDVQWSFMMGGTVAQTSRIRDNSVFFEGSGAGFAGGGVGQRYARTSMVFDFSLNSGERFSLAGEVKVSAGGNPSGRAWVRLIDLATNTPIVDETLAPPANTNGNFSLPFDLDGSLAAGAYRFDVFAEGINHGGVARATLTIGAICYANCDGSTAQPILNVNDFICFQTKYAAADPGANCDGSTTEPILNVNDFICFQTQFAAGCP